MRLCGRDWHTYVESGHKEGQAKEVQIGVHKDGLDFIRILFCEPYKSNATKKNFKTRLWNQLIAQNFYPSCVLNPIHPWNMISMRSNIITMELINNHDYFNTQKTTTMSLCFLFHIHSQQGPKNKNTHNPKNNKAKCQTDVNFMTSSLPKCCREKIASCMWIQKRSRPREMVS